MFMARLKVVGLLHHPPERNTMQKIDPLDSGTRAIMCVYSTVLIHSLMAFKQPSQFSAAPAAQGFAESSNPRSTESPEADKRRSPQNQGNLFLSLSILALTFDS
jgi:hypothetical protein